MKYLKLLFVALATVLMFGCSTATVNFDSSNRITSISGLSSGDATDLVKSKAYYEAKATEKVPPIVHIKAKPGQEVTGLESVTVWDVSKTKTVEAPVSQPSVFVQTLREVRETIKDAAKYVLPAVMFSEQQKTERQRIQSDEARDANNTAAWAEALKKEQDKPEVIFAPESPPATTP